MAKGYWAGRVFEIRNQERFDRYVEKAMAIFAEEAAKGTGNFVPLAVGEPKGIIQKGPTGAALFGGIVAFNSLEEAIAGHEDPRYQAALAELGEDPGETVVRTLAIFEGA